jgi:hypothetical protein
MNNGQIVFVAEWDLICLGKLVPVFRHASGRDGTSAHRFGRVGRKWYVPTANGYDGIIGLGIETLHGH